MIKYPSTIQSKVPITGIESYKNNFGTDVILGQLRIQLDKLSQNQLSPKITSFTVKKRQQCIDNSALPGSYTIKLHNTFIY